MAAVTASSTKAEIWAAYQALCDAPRGNGPVGTVPEPAHVRRELRRIQRTVGGIGANGIMSAEWDARVAEVEQALADWHAIVAAG